MKNNNIIIIGGGVAGMSAGIYGQLNGFKTQIFEMHSIPGGQCTAWDKQGYRFDYCLHWLIGTRNSVFNDIWKETNVINENVNIVDNEIHTVIRDDKWGEFIICTNIDKWQEYLIRMAGEDARSIRKMCRQMKMGTEFEPFEKGPDLRKITDYFKILIKMRRLLPVVIKYGKMSAKTYFKKLKFRNPKLTYFLNKLYGENNYSALIVIMMLGWFHAKNAGYLVGGSLALAQRMAERYRTLGGELLVRKKVKRILVEKGKAVGIQLSDGIVYKADYVISAADGHTTLFDMLEGKYLSPVLKKAYARWELYTPFVQVAFGIKEKLVSEAPLITYLQEKFTLGNLEVNHGYSIMNQSSIDPTLAPEGKTTIILRFDSAWENWENLKPEEYEKTKEMIREKGIDILETHYPGVREKIEVVDVSTPRTAVKYTGVWKGAYEGFLPTGNMMKKTLKNTLPHLKSFYMVGQWMFPGGGLPPSAQSGKWVIQTICKEERKKFRVK